MNNLKKKPTKKYTKKNKLKEKSNKLELKKNANTKKAIKKTIKKHASNYKKTKTKKIKGGEKRKRQEEKVNCNFQNLIDLIGDTDLLEGLVHYLTGNEIIAHIDPKGKRPEDLAPCLIFKRGHWKGYKKNNGKLTTYDSYLSDVQQKKTNNYCQSFAAYLFSNDGLNELQKGNLSHNVQVISKTWIDYFNYLNDLDPSYLPKKINEIKEERLVNNDTELIECNESLTLNNIMNTLQKLRDNEYYAQKFATSKE